jgi:hypothetical protein
MASFQSSFLKGYKAGSRTPKQDAAIEEKKIKAARKRAIGREKGDIERIKFEHKIAIERERTKRAEIKLFRGK